MNRPTVTQEMIYQASAETARQCGSVSASEHDRLASDIASLHMRGHPDGFEIGKDLDRMGWDVDANMVQELDCYGSNLYVIRQAAEKKWAEENNIQPPIPIGSAVRAGRLQKIITGTITGISKTSPACYEIKPDGQDDSIANNCRHIVRFEDVELVAIPA